MFLISNLSIILDNFDSYIAWHPYSLVQIKSLLNLITGCPQQGHFVNLINFISVPSSLYDSTIVGITSLERLINILEPIPICFSCISV